MSWDLFLESRHCPGDRRACQAGPQLNCQEGGVSGHVAIPPALETSMATSMSWPPMRDYWFWINQAVYNWYPGDDHDCHTVVPWHVRKPNAHKAGRTVGPAMRRKVWLQGLSLHLPSQPLPVKCVVA